VEFDGRLNTALMKLRAPLNDKSENPIFLETVPRRGYRFIAPIEVALASYEMWPEPRVRQLTHGTSRSVGKGYRWNAHLPLVREVIAGTRCIRRSTESGKETGVVVRGSRRRGRVLRRSDVTLGFSSATEYKLNSTNCARRVHCD